MPEDRQKGVDREKPRRWSFAGCTFDEASWSLIVDGQRLAMEPKPLELLRALLANAGSVMSKDALLDAIWPDVMVVEASLPTAIYKLRGALHDDGQARRIIETVSGIGYRLIAPVEVEALATPGATPPAGPPTASRAEEARPAEQRRPRMRRIFKLAAISGGAVAGSMLVAFPLLQPQNISAASAPRSISQRDAANALRQLDVPAVERMLAAGWDPNRPFDGEGNAALSQLLNMCEWDRGHDRRRMLLMARTLFEAGARVDQRNVWGDTPYSIASAERYCGPHHPVTEMMRTICNSGPHPLGDRCLASYQLVRRRPG